MSVSRINNENDWSFGGGLSDYLSQSDEIKQNVKTRLQSWVGDCFFARLDGVNYSAFMEKGNEDLLENDIKRVIMQTYGVAQVEEISVNIDVDRSLNCSYTIIDIYSNKWNDILTEIGL